MDFANTKIVRIEGGKLWLSSSLDQDAFGRTNLALSIEEKGKTAEFDDKNVKFSDFSFTAVEEDKNGSVYFTSPLENAETFLEILNSENFDDKKKNAVKKLILALTEAYENKIDLKISGAEGILFSDGKIIFLPAELFAQCVSNSRNGENFKYIYKGLEDSEQVLFFRSVAAYKALTGNLPFEEDDLTKRQTDIADEKFIPLELYLPDLDKTLSAAIDAGLKIRSEQKHSSGRREFSDAKEEKKRKDILAAAEKFDAEKFDEELQRAAGLLRSARNDGKEPRKDDGTSRNDAELEAKRKSFLKKQNAKVASKRFFRRNRNALLALLAFAVFAFWMASGFVRENRLLATTKGLNSTQAAALMYSFIHRADVPNLQEVAKGKYTKDLIFKVAGFYVTAKQREEQNAGDKSVTPGEWLFYKQNSSNWMYGITNLKIDGKPFPAESGYPKRKDKPLPIKEENGKILKRGDKASHSAEYYLVHQDSNRIYAEKISETVTLSWKGKRWVATSVEGKSEPLSVSAKAFSDEYYALLGGGKSIHDAAAQLRGKYEWLPDEADMRNDAKTLAEKYGSVEAEKFLAENGE